MAALLTMGLSTVAIGLLPSYASIGIAAPALLALCRLGQGLGLGGEWGGAVLLAIENAPPGQRAWYGMFPQLGAPLGFVCSSGVFLLLTRTLDDAAFLAWGWRVPFLASAALVFVGLWVRLRISETPEFDAAIARHERVRVPLFAALRESPRALVVGMGAAIATFVLFYLMTVFTLSYATTRLGIPRERFLALQLVGVLCFGATIPVSAWLAGRLGCRAVIIAATVAILAFGALFEPLFGLGGDASSAAFLAIGLGLMGLTYAPLGTAIAGLFPTAVRYTGASVAFNFAGIVGASLAPYAATWLAQRHGLWAVGAYLSAAAALTLIAALALPEDRPARSESA